MYKQSSLYYSLLYLDIGDVKLPDEVVPLKADRIIREIKRAGIRFIVALPDRTTSEHILKPLLQDLMDVTNAQNIIEGKFKIKFL